MKNENKKGAAVSFLLFLKHTPLFSTIFQYVFSFYIANKHVLLHFMFSFYFLNKQNAFSFYFLNTWWYGEKKILRWLAAGLWKCSD